MTDWQDYYHSAIGAQAAAEDALYGFPEIAAAARSASPPVVRLSCPRGHYVDEVTLQADHNWHLSLTGSESRPGGSAAADPLGSDAGVSAERVRLACGRCGYAGVHTQARLLKLYAVALRLGRSEIPLPS